MKTFEKLGVWAGILACSVAMWTWGYMTAQGSYQGLNDLLKEQNAKLQRDGDRLGQEALQLKTQLVTLTARQVAASREAANESEMKGGARDSQHAGPAPEAKEPKTERVVLSQGGSGTAFDGGLTISLIRSTLEGEPLRYQVSAAAGLPNAEPITFKGVDVGHRALVGPFEVRLASAGFQSAEFWIQRVPPRT